MHTTQPRGRFKQVFKRVNQHVFIGRWLILLTAVLILVTCTYYTFKVKTSNISNLKASLSTTTTVYDAAGKKAGSLYAQKGSYVGYAHISPNIKHAVVATEDRTFWTNGGFSIKGMARAGVNLILHHGEITGGGSTLTQQLAKNSLLTQQQTYSRKLEELFFAIELNHVYSKKDILTMYLNNAYFGNGVWGVQDASRRYFGKNASQLSVGEAATLAGMLRNPSYYNPVDHMANALYRRNTVLQLMAVTHKISAGTARTVSRQGLLLNNTYRGQRGYKYPYFFDTVIDEAIRRYGLTEEDVMTKGLKIYTTLNQSYQTQMQNSFADSTNFPANPTGTARAQGASVAIDPKTGAIKGVVGGNGRHVFRGYNRAIQMRRQPGSSIKPLAVYTPALEHGYHYDSKLSDRLQKFGKNHYEPRNVDNTYSPTVPMYSAVAWSKNVPAVWLLDKLGVDQGAASLKNFGISVPKRDQNLTLALGGLSSGVSPLQMARAYAAFANKGNLPNQTYAITKITDASGRVIAQNNNTGNHKIISAATVKEMTTMLLGVFTNGTAQAAQPSGYEVAGKTGSTEVSFAYGTKDQWIVGYTPDVVLATWVGFDSTNRQNYMQGISETGITKLYQSEMNGLLPYTSGNKFNVKPPDQLLQSSGAGSDWTDQVKRGFKNIRGRVGTQINRWYNKLKGYFDK